MIVFTEFDEIQSYLRGVTDPESEMALGATEEAGSGTESEAARPRQEQEIRGRDDP
jgi:hypothetical protein